MVHLHADVPFHSGLCSIDMPAHAHNTVYRVSEAKETRTVTLAESFLGRSSLPLDFGMKSVRLSPPWLLTSEKSRDTCLLCHNQQWTINTLCA